MQNYEFIDKDGSFRLKGAENDRELYFPIAGEHGLKSAITPNLCGDAKLDQNHFLLEPQSVGDLAQKRISRNFWCMIKERGVWSVKSFYRNYGDLCGGFIIQILSDGIKGLTGLR